MGDRAWAGHPWARAGAPPAMNHIYARPAPPPRATVPGAPALSVRARRTAVPHASAPVRMAPYCHSACLCACPSPRLRAARPRGPALPVPAAPRCRCARHACLRAGRPADSGSLIRVRWQKTGGRPKSPSDRLR
nr:hypothetical protein Aca09nite_75690 [Actinoplanes campanulatus]